MTAYPCTLIPEHYLTCFPIGCLTSLYHIILTYYLSLITVQTLYKVDVNVYKTTKIQIITVQ